MSKKNTPNNKCYRNFWWVIGILLIIIICLISYICSVPLKHNGIILTFLEFSGTLLSIVLSIFAISYSYFSALEASRQWSDISKAVEGIKSTNKNIETTNKFLMETLRIVHGKVSELKGASQYANEQKTTTIDNISNIKKQDNNN